MSDPRKELNGMVMDCYSHPKGGWSATVHFSKEVPVGTQLARADLEAENERLREALATLQMQCNSLAASNWREWQELASPQEFERWVKSRAVHMEALARAALEGKP